MNILVTGAKGFVGKNLVASLNNIKESKDKTRPDLIIDQIFEFDVDSSMQELEEYCQKADFVFNLAGVNRPQNKEEFMDGNFGFVGKLLNTLKKYHNTCPVMLSSSIQAALDNDYGKSKKAGEDLFYAYGKETGAKVFVYRFTNIFGKWSRPNYNSAVATFCNNIANDLPIQINGRETRVKLLYIDDLVSELLNILEGKPQNTELAQHDVSLGEIADLLESFKAQPQSLMLPNIPNDSFAKKLYSTYLSYLPQSKVKFGLKTNTDIRGSFTELLKTIDCGQFSVNISKPGITKGQHWHHSKWEFFIVVFGHAKIEERKIGTDEKMVFEVSGEKIEAVHMLPGYTHNIINLSDTEDLVTLMWANEQFDPNHPDTYFEEV